MSEAQAFIAAGRAQQDQRFVIAEAETLDRAQATGAWVATDRPTDLAGWR